MDVTHVSSSFLPPTRPSGLDRLGASTHSTHGGGGGGGQSRLGDLPRPGRPKRLSVGMAFGGAAEDRGQDEDGQRHRLRLEALVLDSQVENREGALVLYSQVETREEALVLGLPGKDPRRGPGPRTPR